MFNANFQREKNMSSDPVASGEQRAVRPHVLCARVFVLIRFSLLLGAASPASLTLVFRRQKRSSRSGLCVLSWVSGVGKLLSRLLSLLARATGCPGRWQRNNLFARPKAMSFGR